MAVLAAYGAEAIHPYLALETIEQLYKPGNPSGIDAKTATQNYIHAIGKTFKQDYEQDGYLNLHELPRRPDL